MKISYFQSFNYILHSFETFKELVNMFGHSASIERLKSQFSTFVPGNDIIHKCIECFDKNDVNNFDKLYEIHKNMIDERLIINTMKVWLKKKEMSHVQYFYNYYYD